MVTNIASRDVGRLIDEAVALLGQAKELLEAPPGQEEEDLGGKVLAEILERGASVSKQELYAIAERNGMDRRGLGGFFRQSGKTSLYVLPGDRVVLTPYGAEQARRYQERRPSIVYEPTIEYAKVAEESFAEDWDSDEDAVYDAL